jgi:hypothetical protein
LTFDPVLLTYKVDTLAITLNLGFAPQNYTIRLHGRAIYDASGPTTFTDFVIELHPNTGPIASTTFSNTYTMYAHHNTAWQIDFTDKELDAIIIETFVEQPLGTVISTPSWVAIDNTTVTNRAKVTITSPPQPPTGPTFHDFYIRYKIYDSFGGASPNFYTPKLNILRNYAPTMNSPALNATMDTIGIPFGFWHTIWKSDFTDAEGDAFTISCAVSSTTTTIGSAWT